MAQVFKTLTKILLMFFGATMLLGGGVCVATNVVFTVSSLFPPDPVIGLSLLLMGVSGVFAWTGWTLLKYSRNKFLPGSDK